MNFRFVLLLTLLGFAAPAKAGTLARFHLGVGVIDVELFDQDKPLTVQNFIAYTRAGVWNDTIFHRFVPGFVVQGGSYYLPHSATGFTPLNVQPQGIPTLPPVRNEYSVGRTFSNTYGTIAMARVGGQPDSATASWFFNLEDNSDNLDRVDGGFTVFGRMIRGNAALDYFRPPYPPTLRLIPQASQNDGIPIFTPDNGQTRFWFNVSVSLLTVQIARVAGGMEIAWNSVEGLPNVVEFTRAHPPQWTEAATVTGTGERMSITDAPGTDALRQYRVRVVYPN